MALSLRLCLLACVLAHVFLYVSARFSECVCTHACVSVCLNKPTLESFIIGPVRAVSIPEGNKVEMRDRKSHGGATCTHVRHTSVPSGGHASHNDVFYKYTSVCFLENKFAVRAGRKSTACCLWWCFVNICHSRLFEFHDRCWLRTPDELVSSDNTC